MSASEKPLVHEIIYFRITEAGKERRRLRLDADRVFIDDQPAPPVATPRPTTPQSAHEMQLRSRGIETQPLPGGGLLLTHVPAREQALLALFTRAGVLPPYLEPLRSEYFERLSKLGDAPADENCPAPRNCAQAALMRDIRERAEKLVRDHERTP